MRTALVAAIVLFGCGAPRTPDAAEPAPPPAPTAHAIVAPQAPLPRDLVVRFGEPEPPPRVDPCTLVVTVDTSLVPNGASIAVFRADTYIELPAGLTLDYSTAVSRCFSADEHHYLIPDGSIMPFDDLSAGEHVIEVWVTDALRVEGESGPLRIVRVTLVRGDNVLTID